MRINYNYYYGHDGKEHVGWRAPRMSAVPAGAALASAFLAHCDAAYGDRSGFLRALMRTLPLASYGKCARVAVCTCSGRRHSCYVLCPGTTSETRPPVRQSPKPNQSKVQRDVRFL